MFVGSPDEDVDLRTRLFQQTLHEEGPYEAGTASEQNIVQNWCFGQGRKRRRLEDKLAVVLHHPLFRHALLFAESSQVLPERIECFFGSPLQLFGQSKQLGYAHTLNE